MSPWLHHEKCRLCSDFLCKQMRKTKSTLWETCRRICGLQLLYLEISNFSSKVSSFDQSNSPTSKWNQAGALESSSRAEPAPGVSHARMLSCATTPPWCPWHAVNWAHWRRRDPWNHLAPPVSPPRPYPLRHLRRHGRRRPSRRPQDPAPSSFPCSSSRGLILQGSSSVAYKWAPSLERSRGRRPTPPGCRHPPLERQCWAPSLGSSCVHLSSLTTPRDLLKLYRPHIDEHHHQLAGAEPPAADVPLCRRTSSPTPLPAPTLAPIWTTMNPLPTPHLSPP
jgi:hypothetical protein